MHQGLGKSEKVSVASKQLFVQKTKDIVFTESTSKALIDKSLLESWLSESKYLTDWVDTFAVSEKAEYLEEVKESKFLEKKIVMDKAKRFATPLRKRVRDSLKEEDPWMFSGLDNTLSLEEQLTIIENALQENQKEHERFQQCHLDLEESIRLASYAYKYGAENLHLRIGKKSKAFGRQILWTRCILHYWLNCFQTN